MKLGCKRRCNLYWKHVGPENTGTNRKWVAGEGGGRFRVQETGCGGGMYIVAIRVE